MRLFLMMYSGPSPDRVTAILERHDLHDYTLFEGGRGAGRTGRREGTRAWPGETTVLLSAVPLAHAEALATTLEQEAEALPAGERLHLAVLPIERFF
ncbi:MAG: hypothetical protein KJZ74_13620 [Gemmatimonadales bacterium]|nr:hypothetical protein [Gemmatimonadales bacterium]